MSQHSLALFDSGSVSTEITRGQCSGSEKSFFGNFFTFTFQTDGPLFYSITFSELIWCQLNSNESRRNTSVWNCLHTLSWAELAVIFQRTRFFETVGGEPKATNIFWMGVATGDITSVFEVFQFWNTCLLSMTVKRSSRNTLNGNPK